MKLFLRILHGFLILSLLLLALKPLLLPSSQPVQSTTQYTFQYDCQNRLSTALGCASTAYYMMDENHLNEALINPGLLISLVYFTMTTLATSAPKARLLRPPIHTS